MGDCANRCINIQLFFDDDKIGRSTRRDRDGCTWCMYAYYMYYAEAFLMRPSAFPDIEKEVHYVRAASASSVCALRGAINIRYSHPTEKRSRPNFCGWNTLLPFLYPHRHISPCSPKERSKNPFRPCFLPFLSPCHFLRFLRYPHPDVGKKERNHITGIG